MRRPTQSPPAPDEAFDYAVSRYRIVGRDDDRLLLESISGPNIAVGLVRIFAGLIVILVADVGSLNWLAGWSALQLACFVGGLAAVGTGIDAILRTDRIGIHGGRRIIEQHCRRFGKWLEPVVTPFERIEYITLRFGWIGAGGIGRVRGWSLDAHAREPETSITLNASTDWDALVRLADFIEQVTGIPVDRTRA
jgi:hypothetical protein